MVASGVFTTANLVSYCSAEDVLALLGGYDTGDWGSEEKLLAEATALLAPTKSAIDSAAGRDFMLHAGETVALDGSGSRVLLLAPLGLTPVVEVHTVAVDGRELGEDEWLFYRDEAAVVLAIGASPGRRFPRGRQNVEVTLDWGWEATPPDIISAQAKLAAAELLSKWTGEGGEVESVRLGDYAVRYGGSGGYARSIRRLVAEAQEAVARYRRIEFCAI